MHTSWTSMRMGAAPPACRLCQHQLCSDHASHHPSPPSQFDPACNTIAAPTMFSTVFVCFSFPGGMPSGVQGWPWCSVHCHQVVAHQEKHWQRRLRQHSHVASSCSPEQVYRMPRMSAAQLDLFGATPGKGISNVVLSLVYNSIISRALHARTK